MSSEEVFKGTKEAAKRERATWNTAATANDHESDSEWLEEKEENPLEKLKESPGDENYQIFEPRDASAGQLFVLVGKSERGKTHFLKWLLYKGCTRERAPFLFGLIFVRTKFKLSYRFHPESADNVKVFEGFSVEVLKQYVKNLEKRYKEQGYVEPSFIVFDDLAGVLSNETAWFQNFIATYRHYNITLFIAVQYLTGRKCISPIMREQTSACIMFNSKVKLTLTNLWQCYGQLFDKQKDFEDHLNRMTDETVVGTRHACCIYFEHIDAIEQNYMSWLAPAELPDDVLVMGIEASKAPSSSTQKKARGQDRLGTSAKKFMAIQEKLEKEKRSVRFAGRQWDRYNPHNTVPLFSDVNEGVAHLHVIDDLMRRHEQGLLHPDDPYFKRRAKFEDSQVVRQYDEKDRNEKIEKLLGLKTGTQEEKEYVEALRKRMSKLPMWFLERLLGQHLRPLAP